MHAFIIKVLYYFRYHNNDCIDRFVLKFTTFSYYSYTTYNFSCIACFHQKIRLFILNQQNIFSDFYLEILLFTIHAFLLMGILHGVIIIFRIYSTRDPSFYPVEHFVTTSYSFLMHTRVCIMDIVFKKNGSAFIILLDKNMHSSLLSSSLLFHMGVSF